MLYPVLKCCLVHHAIKAYGVYEAKLAVGESIVLHWVKIKEVVILQTLLWGAN